MLRVIFFPQWGWNILPRIVFEFFQPDTVLVNFCFDIAIGRTGERHSYRAGTTVTRQTNDANIMSEIFTSKLRTNTKLLTGLEQHFFQLNITECLSLLVSAGGQIVVIFRRGQLGNF